MFISAVRCTLSYLVFPFALPVLGITAGIGTGVGFVITIVAIAANGLSIRRFWSSRHPYKVYMSVANAAMICALAVLLVGDLNDVAF